MVMKKLLTSLLLLLLILTGCGGGGSSPEPVPIKLQPVSQFESPAKLPADKFRLARIDYRFDTPASNKDINGNHTTSYDAVKPMIDNIKQVGFTGVIFQLQTPINKDTGLVGLHDQAPNDKTLPKDTWKLIDYAKSQGLSVWISLSIVDSVTDCFLTPDFKKYTEQQMFSNIITYQKNIATVAQQHLVDGLFISEGNYNLESYDHLFYWQQLISELRKVFSGKLSYTTYLFEPTSIWNHVDYASISVNHTLSKTPIYDLKSIMNLYYNDASNINEIQRIKDFYMVYGKKFILVSSPILADIGVGNTPQNFWDNVINNIWTNISLPQIDKEMHSLKIRAFLEVVHKYLPDITDGVVFSEYSPWLQHVSFTTPKTNDVGVYKYYCCGGDLTNNTDAQKTINSYFSKPWGYYTVQ
jgi:hypothetical protein